MDEVTIVNLLNKICEINRDLNWNMSCKYHDGISVSVMQIRFTNEATGDKSNLVTFDMESGQVLNGKYAKLGQHKRGTQIIDSLLDVLSYERTRQSIKAS